MGVSAGRNRALRTHIVSWRAGWDRGACDWAGLVRDKQIEIGDCASSRTSKRRAMTCREGDGTFGACFTRSLAPVSGRRPLAEIVRRQPAWICELRPGKRVRPC